MSSTMPLPSAPTTADGERRNGSAARSRLPRVVEEFPLEEDSAATMAALREQLAPLWQRYKGSIVRRVEILEGASRAALAGGLDDAEKLSAYSEAHKLVGDLGTFGVSLGMADLIEASDLAQQIEQLLESQAPLRAADADRLSQMVADLRETLDQAAHAEPSEGKAENE